MYIASFVLGLVAITSFFFPIGGVIISSVAFGIAIAAMVKKSRVGGKGSNLCITGFILSTISIIIAPMATMTYFMAVGTIINSIF